MKRFLSAFLTFILVVLCSSTAFSEQTKEEEAVFTREMIENSLVSVGNTERIHKAVDKARSGEDVTIAYLGGSITEGAQAKPQKTKCYAYVSYEIFRDRYASDPEKVHYVNAGISGTPSLLGLTRLEQDVLSKTPDIVFVEFAVNDSTDHQSKVAYESLVRRLINSETQPAVILIFTLMSSGYNAQEHMEEIGKYYDLGMISVKNAISPEIKKGTMTFRDYSSDYAHPTTEGHAFIADMIAHYFSCALEAEGTPYAFPDSFRYGRAYEALKNIRKNDPCIETTGSFALGVYPCYSYIYGYKHVLGAGNNPMTLNIEAGHMTVAYRQEKNADCGKMEILDDGKVIKTLNGFDENAWGNIVTTVIDFPVTKKRTIEFRMIQGDELKNFTIYDIGIVP